MARMLSCKLLMATVMAIGLGFNSMTAQEADRPNCDEKKCDEAQAGLEFAFPGISLKFKIATDDETQDIDCPKCAARYSSIPFLSNLKHADRLFKNVGLDDVRKKSKGVEVGKIRIQANCEDGPACCDASSACREECPPCYDVSAACCDGCPDFRVACGNCCVGCRVNQPACDEGTCCPNHQTAMLPKLKFVETFTFRGTKPNMAPVDPREQMFQLRMENERLKMQVAAMNERMEWVAEMAELRAHNQVLEARLEMHAKHGRPTHTNRAIPKCSCCPPSTAIRPPHSVQWVPAVAHPSVPPQAFPARRLPPQPPVVKSPTLPRASYVLPTNGTIVLPQPPVQPTQTERQESKAPVNPANKISVPDGGTFIFGGGIKRKMHAVPTPPIVARTASLISPRPPAPARPKLNQAAIDRMEKQIKKLECELKQLKSKQPLAPIKAVPMKGKFKSFQPAEPAKDSSSQSDQQTFQFYVGTLR